MLFCPSAVALSVHGCMDEGWLKVWPAWLMKGIENKAKLPFFARLGSTGNGVFVSTDRAGDIFPINTWNTAWGRNLHPRFFPCSLRVIFCPLSLLNQRAYMRVFATVVPGITAERGGQGSARVSDSPGAGAAGAPIH